MYSPFLLNGTIFSQLIQIRDAHTFHIHDKKRIIQLIGPISRRRAAPKQSAVSCCLSTAGPPAISGIEMATPPQCGGPGSGMRMGGGAARHRATPRWVCRSDGLSVHARL